jgi:hypothetical protein
MTPMLSLGPAPPVLESERWEVLECLEIHPIQSLQETLCLSVKPQTPPDESS